MKSIEKDRKNNSIYGNLLLGILFIVILILGHNDLSNPLKDYYRGDGLMGFLSNTKSFGGDYLLYLFISLISLWAFYEAYCKYKKIEQKKPKGMAQILWICLRMGTIMILLPMMYQNVNCSSFFWQEYKMVIITVFAPLAILMVFWKTKKPIAPFVIIIVYAVLGCSFFLRITSKKELKEEKIITIAVVENIIIQKSSRHKYNCQIVYKFNEREDSYLLKSNSSSKAYIFNNISIGDTIIVAYSPKCDHIRKVINFFPASDEIKAHSQVEL